MQFKLVSFGMRHDALHGGGGSAILSVTDRCQRRCGDWLTVRPICAVSDQIRLVLWSRDTFQSLGLGTRASYCASRLWRSRRQQ